MKIRSGLVLAAAAGAACSAMAGTPNEELIGGGIQVDPIAVRGVRLTADGYEWTTDLIPYTPRHTRTNYNAAFDCFEQDAQLGAPTDGAALGGYDPDCAMGGSRWFFGSTNESPVNVNDMVVDCDGHAGVLVEKLAYAWYVARDAEFVVLVFTAEDFDLTGAGYDNDGDGFVDDVATNYYSGVAYFFGFMTGPAGYYYTNIDLTGSGLAHQMPMDGEGAYRIEYWDDYDFDGIIDPFYDLRAGAQSMNWTTGCPPDNQGCEGGVAKNGNFSHQESVVWFDWGTLDGIYTPDEFYDYARPANCTGPARGPMMVFYANDADQCGADCPPDMNGDGVVNSQDFIMFLNLFVAGDPRADFNGDGNINSQDFVAFLNAFVAGC